MTVTWVALGLALLTGTAAVADLGAAASRARGGHRRLSHGAHPRHGRVGLGLDRLARTAVARRVEGHLAAAGVPVAPVPFVTGAGVLLLAAAVAVARSTSGVLAVLALAVGLAGLRAGLRRRVARRRDDLIAQLPDLARLLSNAAGAGLALRSGLELAAREIAEPARSELHRVTQALAVGDPLERALGDLARRLPSREVSVLVTTLLVQQQAGGRTITALRALASALEARKEVRREIRTIMAGAVSSTYLVLGMGIGSVLLLEVATPGVLDGLAGTGPGRLALAASAALDGIGLVAIRRLTRIEV